MINKMEFAFIVSVVIAALLIQYALSYRMSSEYSINQIFATYFKNNIFPNRFVYK